MRDYVVLSDLHLGEKVDECTFAKKSNINSFIKELEALGPIKELVLLGDVLELSLAPMSEVTKQMKALFGGINTIHDKIEKVIYVPGNHDHHIWTLHVEQKIAEDMRMGRSGSDFELPDYTGGKFVGTDSFISGYFPDDGLKEKLVIKYPIHEIELSNGKTCLLHHGHQIYGVGVRLLSLKEALNDPIPQDEQMKELELQNIGVYELLWFYLELSGRMRRRVEQEWKKRGGFGAFSVVAKEMADKRVVSAGHEIYKFFHRKPKERGRTIGGNKEEFGQYLRVCDKAPECLIYGHSHVPELLKGTDLDDHLPEIIGNCGSWIEENKRNQEPNTYIVINTDGVDLRRLGEGVEEHIEWS
jgi:UDP-2,3-diacylglucosamine pyrophosphatase LpxH